MFDRLSRREAIAGLGAAALSPLTARAQNVTPLIGVLGSENSELGGLRYAAFKQALAEAGYVDGRNVAVEYRWSGGRVERFPELASELVRRQVNVIASLAGIPATKAAKAATTTIPVVFQGGFDPVEIGVVSSMSRPGGNVTGITNLGLELGPKRLEVMHELLPDAKTFALIINPDHPNFQTQTRMMEAAAQRFGLEIRSLHAAAFREFDPAFAKAAQLGVDGIVIGFGQPFTDHHRELGELAARYRIPTISEAREAVAAGALLSYSGNREDAFRLAGLYVGRILKGEKPADLPVQQATKVEMVINMKAAKALGVNVPLPLLGRADEVIE
jgi:putative ABC transport system substrate-binding protein